MKRSVSILAAGLVAVNAQANLPQCGQTCVNNMLAIAVSNFGCDANNLAECACCNVDFGFGIRDCSQATCGDGTEDYSSAISYGSSYCASAVTSCPSGTQALSPLTTATGQQSGSAVASGSSMPAMTSGPLAAAIAAISPASGSPDAYVVGSSTISAGGDAYEDEDISYTALPNSGGVLVSGEDAQTTYVPGAVASGSGNMSMTSGGALGAAASSASLVAGSSNVYAIGDNTVSAGGDAYDNSGTTYSALPSGFGILIAANGASSTYNPAADVGNAGAGATIISDVTILSGDMTSSSSMSQQTTAGGAAGGSNNNDGSDSDSSNSDQSSSASDSGNFAPIQTAAPALIGAAAMAIFAL